MPPILQHLNNPEYIHTLINPLPVYGLSMGVVALIIALISKRRAVVVAALILVFLSSLSAWPTYNYGEAAYDRVTAMSDPAGVLWLDEHMARAGKLIKLFYLLAALAVAGILAPLKWPRSSVPLAIIALVLAIGTLGAGGWIAYAGGHVRHKEFRFEPPPIAKKSDGHTHTHGADKGAMDHNAMQDTKAESEKAKPMDHGSMPGMEKSKSGGDSKEQPMPHDAAMPPAPLTPEQLEASRLQLEASRLQLEASRKQLEAADAAKAQSTSPVPSPSPATSGKPTATPDGRDHKH
jgi:disulfide bond formation protein DsbB